MVNSEPDPLEHLSEPERRCVRSYIATLADRLGDDLVEVWLFGSAARGDMWSDRFPIRSDIDLLVLTRRSLPSTAQEELINETYPLFLECGRQMSPQWRTLEEWASPPDDRARSFVDRVRGEGRKLYPAAQLAFCTGRRPRNLGTVMKGHRAAAAGEMPSR